MAQETDTTLRKALDAMDRYKKRMSIGLACVVFVTVVAQLRLASLSRTADIARMLVTSVAVLEFWVTACAVMVVLQIAVATRRIVRAIELASKPSA